MRNILNKAVVKEKFFSLYGCSAQMMRSARPGRGKGWRLKSRGGKYEVMTQQEHFVAIKILNNKAKVLQLLLICL